MRRNPEIDAALNAFNPGTDRPKCRRPDCYLPAVSQGQCEHHAMQAHQAKADAHSRELGLKTPAEHREWLKANAGKGFKRFEDATPPTREPGQDDEERTDLT